MKSKFKILSVFSLLFIMLTLVGCGNNTSNNDAGNNDTTNNATNNANNNADNKEAPPTNQEYYDYLTERYNYYFGNNDLDTTYDIFVDDLAKL